MANKLVLKTSISAVGWVWCRGGSDHPVTTTRRLMRPVGSVGAVAALRCWLMACYRTEYHGLALVPSGVTVGGIERVALDHEPGSSTDPLSFAPDRAADLKGGGGPYAGPAIGLASGLPAL